MKVLVIGDLILDKYIEGTCDRISPEACVPVIKKTNEYIKIGGAGNVVLNLESLGIHAQLLSLIGSEEQYIKLLNSNIKNHSMFSQENRRTTVKTRITSGNQLLRIDEEDTEPIPFSMEISILEYINFIIDDFDFVIISDYDKGLCTEILTEEIIKICNSKNIKILIDPKVKSLKYRNSYILKCNRKEAELLTGTSDMKEAINILRIVFNIKHPIITLGSEGVIAWVDKIIEFSSEISEVIDVTGAGDCVISAIVYSLQNNSLEKSIELANSVAGIAVKHKGNYILKEEDFKKETIVFTNGCFDILHAGHIHILKEAKKLGTKLIVGLNSDYSVRRLKGLTRPINSEGHRKILLESLSFVDEVIIFNEDTPYELIKKLKPDILVKGNDYIYKDVVGSDLVPEVALISTYEDLSSSSIIRIIKESK